MELNNVKRDAVRQYKESDEFKDEMVDACKEGFELFHDYHDMVATDKSSVAVNIGGVLEVELSNNCEYHQNIVATRKPAF